MNVLKFEFDIAILVAICIILFSVNIVLAYYKPFFFWAEDYYEIPNEFIITADFYELRQQWKHKRTLQAEI